MTRFVTSIALWIALSPVVLAQNLITNRSFEAGNTDFSSEYTFVSGGSCAGSGGRYDILSDPNDCLPAFASCSPIDGSLQAVVNGSDIADRTVWSETVTIQADPGAMYTFEFVAQSLTTGSPANLQATVNGVAIGSPLQLSSTTCQQETFTGTWIADASTYSSRFSPSESYEVCSTVRGSWTPR